MKRLIELVVISVWPVWLLIAVCTLLGSVYWCIVAVDPMYSDTAKRLKQGEQAKSDWLDQKQQYLDYNDGK